MITTAERNLQHQVVLLKYTEVEYWVITPDELNLIETEMGNFRMGGVVCLVSIVQLVKGAGRIKTALPKRPTCVYPNSRFVVYKHLHAHCG